MTPLVYLSFYDLSRTESCSKVVLGVQWIFMRESCVPLMNGNGMRVTVSVMYIYVRSSIRNTSSLNSRAPGRVCGKLIVISSMP